MIGSHDLGAGILHRPADFKARMTRALPPNKGQSAINEYGASYTVAQGRFRTPTISCAAARFVVNNH